MGFIFLKTELVRYSKKRSFWLWMSFLALILAIFLINGLHEQYPDEFDNILGGWYLLHGKLIYKDWFTHHGPVSYLVSALVNLFSGRSFVNFRLVYSVFLFFLTLLPIYFIRRRLEGVNTSFFAYFILILGLSLTYFWGHMLLADNIAAFFLVPVTALVFLKVVNNKRFDTKEYSFISIFCFLALFSALTYAFLVAGIYLFLIVYYFISEKGHLKFLNLIKIISILLVPYLFFVIYLLLTGSLSSYYYDAIKFNRDYYIYYPGLEGKPPANPVRYAIVIAQGFHNNFSSMLNTVKSFNFDFPFNISLAVSNTALGIYLLLKRKYLAFLFVLGILIFANARTNPFSSRETDYQSAVYIMISLFITAYIIPRLYKELNSNIEYSKKIILSLVFVITIIYAFYNFTFILRKFSYKAYDKYMGFAAIIYDRPKIAPFINQIEDKNSTAWIGPFYYEDLYYMNAKLPSKYQVFLPGMGQSPKISKEFLIDFQNNKPEIVYFNKDFYILGASPKEYGQFFLDYLDSDYITLSDFDPTLKYKLTLDPSLEFDKKLFINKDRADRVVNKMKEQGWIE
ncbi:MAG: hypothetical protein AAB520_03940 [Patescibacteria group bacterium]